MEEGVKEKILDANIAVHDSEAQFYDVIHGEIFNNIEQTRLSGAMAEVDALIENNQKKALDFGAGTGNLTAKLLALGYQVTAIDISANMVRILESKFASHIAAKNLVPIVGDIESLDLQREGFDLVVCYSVLHHLPNYWDVVRRLGSLTKPGGVMYLDHEVSEEYWDMNRLERLVFLFKHLSDLLLNRVYIRSVLGRTKVPRFDYSLSDYWVKPQRHIDHELVRRTIAETGFNSIAREKYHLNRCFYPNPLFYVYRFLCRPDFTSWVAKKQLSPSPAT